MELRIQDLQDISLTDQESYRKGINMFADKILDYMKNSSPSVPLCLILEQCLIFPDKIGNLRFSIIIDAVYRVWIERMEKEDRNISYQDFIEHMVSQAGQECSDDIVYNNSMGLKLVNALKKDYERTYLNDTMFYQKQKLKYQPGNIKNIHADHSLKNTERYFMKEYLLPFYEINYILTYRKSRELSYFYDRVYQYGLTRINQMGFSLSMETLKELQQFHGKFRTFILDGTEYSKSRILNTKKELFQLYLKVVYGYSLTYCTDHPIRSRSDTAYMIYDSIERLYHANQISDGKNGHFTDTLSVIRIIPEFSNRYSFSCFNVLYDILNVLSNKGGFSPELFRVNGFTAETLKNLLNKLSTLEITTWFFYREDQEKIMSENTHEPDINDRVMINISASELYVQILCAIKSAIPKESSLIVLLKAMDKFALSLISGYDKQETEAFLTSPTCPLLNEKNTEYFIDQIRNNKKFEDLRPARFTDTDLAHFYFNCLIDYFLNSNVLSGNGSRFEKHFGLLAELAEFDDYSNELVGRYRKFFQYLMSDEPLKKLYYHLNRNKRGDVPEDQRKRAENINLYMREHGISLYKVSPAYESMIDELCAAIIKSPQEGSEEVELNTELLEALMPDLKTILTI